MIGRLGHGQDRGLERGLERKKGEGGGKRAIRALECGEAEGDESGTKNELMGKLY